MRKRCTQWTTDERSSLYMVQIGARSNACMERGIGN